MLSRFGRCKLYLVLKEPGARLEHFALGVGEIVDGGQRDFGVKIADNGRCYCSAGHGNVGCIPDLNTAT